MFKDILTFGLMLQAGVDWDELGTTIEDDDLLRYAYCKWYGLDPDVVEEMGMPEQKEEIMSEFRNLIDSYRKNVQAYVDELSK